MLFCKLLPPLWYTKTYTFPSGAGSTALLRSSFLDLFSPLPFSFFQKKKGEKGEKNSPLEKPPIILNASAKHRLRALSRNAIICRAPSFLLFSPVLLRYIAITRSFCLREKHRQGKAKNKR